MKHKIGASIALIVAAFAAYQNANGAGPGSILLAAVALASAAIIVGNAP